MRLTGAMLALAVAVAPAQAFALSCGSSGTTQAPQQGKGHTLAARDESTLTVAPCPLGHYSSLQRSRTQKFPSAGPAGGTTPADPQ